MFKPTVIFMVPKREGEWTATLARLLAMWKMGVQTEMRTGRVEEKHSTTGSLQA
jgi:hypothetical protein